MTRRLVLAMALIAATVAVALSIPMVTLVARSEQASIVNELRVETLATASRLSSQARSQWGATVAAAPSRAQERVVVVDASYQLVADSDATALDRTFDRPEIRRALQGTLASDVRASRTLGTQLRYVAAPVLKNNDIVAAVRFSLPEDAVQEAVRRTVRMLAVFVLAVTIVAGFIAWLLAASIAAPVRALARVAGGLHGDLDLRADEHDGPGEVRAVAMALNETAQRLRDLVRRTERVAADASHHLRTPLTGIRLRLEAIEDMTTEPDIATEAGSALAEVDRLTRRIEQVLALSRTDAGNAPRQDVNASESVRARITELAPIAAERGLRIESHIDDGIVVRTDVGAVPRIIDELIGNALHYAASTIVVALHARGERAELVVSDDGRGVPEAEREAIFTRFQRGTGAVQGGSGLGLAMVRETAVACEGSAFAGAAPSGGLAVHVHLPLA